MCVDKVETEAAKLHAIPFDIPGVEFSHHKDNAA